MSAPLSQMMAGWPSLLLGLLCLSMLLVYVCTRMDQLKIGEFRADYIVFNCALSGATLYVFWWTVVAGQAAGLGQLMMAALAGTHLSISYKRHEAFPPMEVMRTDHVRLDSPETVPEWDPRR